MEQEQEQGLDEGFGGVKMGTVQVRKANTILTVPDEEKASFLAKGYDVLGANGDVVEESTPTDTATLQAKYLELKAENEKLKKELAEKKKAKPVTSDDKEEAPKVTKSRAKKQ